MSVVNNVPFALPPKYLGNNYRYIESYAKEANLTPWQACMKVISDTEKVLNMILEWKSRKELGDLQIDGRAWEGNRLIEKRP